MHGHVSVLISYSDTAISIIISIRRHGLQLKIALFKRQLANICLQ